MPIIPTSNNSPAKTQQGDTPEKNLRPFTFHGLDIDLKPGTDQAWGDCPWCGREGKFTVNATTTKWRCMVCGEGGNKGGGNLASFIKVLHLKSYEATGDYKDLLDSRKLLFEDTLMRWGAAKSVIDGGWMLPGFATDGAVRQLYRYVLDHKSGKWRLYATPGVEHQLHFADDYDPKKPDVYLCEGPWDAMALWEILRVSKADEEGDLSLTGSEALSLAAKANVLATPGCNVFKGWESMFSGKRVFLMYDSDYPRKNPKTAAEETPVGLAGMKRVAALLARAEEPPAEIHFLQWGPGGYDDSLPDGVDVRDWLSKRDGKILDRAVDRVAALQTLLGKTKPIPEDWVPGGLTEGAKKGSVEVAILPCDDWETLIEHWKATMTWTEGLDRALSVMLASVISTMAVGDQLWVKIVGPASCGKSTLCEAVSTNRKYVLAKSTIKGFHSGFRQNMHDEKEDNSLLAQLDGKTLVTKDGDTLLQSVNLGQILSEARDVYDRSSRTHYRNKVDKAYNNLSMTWILCGTSSLRALDSSELGERFLDCVIMEKIDTKLEEDILIRAANSADQNMAFEVNKRGDTQYDPDRMKAMQLTGGYVSFLRMNARELLGAVQMSDKAKRECISFGKFVAFMRARPSTKQDESAERELASRLVSQIVRLAKCLAAVLNKPTVDEEVMRRVKRVAMDTARGKVMDIARELHKAGRKDGLEARPLSFLVHMSEEKLPTFLRFLRRIGVTELFNARITSGIVSKNRWRLSEQFTALYQEVVTEELA